MTTKINDSNATHWSSCSVFNMMMFIVAVCSMVAMMTSAIPSLCLLCRGTRSQVAADWSLLEGKMRIVRRNYDGDDHDDDEDDDGGVHITMLVTILIGVMRMSIYVTWKYDEDSFRQENDNGGTIELNAAEIYSKFTKQFIEIAGPKKIQHNAMLQDVDKCDDDGDDDE